MNYSIEMVPTDPYSRHITTFLKKEFPWLLDKRDQGTLLDVLTDAIIATGKTRFGPKPSPESLTSIRQVITHWVAKNEPIPFLVKWGSEKPDGSAIDVAELFALKTIICLRDRVLHYYLPGIAVHAWIQDASAPHLFFEDQPGARRAALTYTSGLVALNKALGLDHWLRMIPESTVVSEATFNAKADEILPAMQAHVVDNKAEIPKLTLAGFGWRQPLSDEVLGYWLGRYAHMYPDKTVAQRQHILARYLAGSAARIVLGINTPDKSWDGHSLELSFNPPLPGLDRTRAERRIYYRTVPSNITSNHLPAWRAKGYLRIDNDNEVSAGLTTFNDKELSFNPNTITISNGLTDAQVRADYVII